MRNAYNVPLQNAPARIVRALACTALMLVAAPVSSSQQAPTPPEFDRVACYQLAQREGRLIARARWEDRVPLETTRAVEFGAETPHWVVELVQQWIGDAYTWRISDENIREWAQELGNVDRLPSASSLSVHESIAIWMRRISKQCDHKV